MLNFPIDVAVDISGNLYIADENNYVVRRVEASSGLITTVAGNGHSGYGGDGGAATSAQIAGPYGVGTDSSGNLFVSDYGNNVVRKVDVSSGAISTVAGTGTAGYGGDGAAANQAKLLTPTGVIADSLGNMYIADTGNNVIRKVVK
jgi:hypothetical protein